MWPETDRRPGGIQNEDAYVRCDCHVCDTLRAVLESDLDGLRSVGSMERPRRLLLTTAQAAELMSISEDALRKLVGEGELRQVTVGTYGRRRIPRSEVDDYISRLLMGELRAWVEARRELKRWGLRYMQEKKRVKDKQGRWVERSGRTYHMGDGTTPLCGAVTEGRWHVETSTWWARDRTCADCEQLSYRMRLEKSERIKRAELTKVVTMLTVVEYGGGGRAVRKAGWHLGDGKTTLCGLTRKTWELPARRPRARPCGVCARSAGVEATS